MKKSRDPEFRKSTLGNTLLLLMVALVAVTAVTYAWFTISDNTRLSALRMDVTTGVSLRIDLDAHEDFTEYKQVLSFGDIAERIRQEKGVDIRSVPIEPVTTADASVFRFEDGSLASAASGVYLEFTLHFMSMGDMYVHLTSTPSRGADNGTRVWSNTVPKLRDAMRISYTVYGKTYIYNPGDDDISGMTDDNMLFFIPEGTDVPVFVHIWIEGTDPTCDNELKGTDYAIQMRFEGSDENNQPFDESDRRYR